MDSSSYPNFTKTMMANETLQFDNHDGGADWSSDWIIPQFAAAGLSILGSYIILREVRMDLHHNDRQRRRGGSGQRDTVSRLLVSLSISQLFLSVGTIFTPAVKTTATCKMQGFLLVVGYIASPLIHAALAGCSWSIVRYNTPASTLKVCEAFLHSSIWVLALLLATVPLPLDMYNKAYEVCWVTPYPEDCKYYDDIPCTRGGDNAIAYEAFLNFFPAWPSIILCTIFLGMIWWTIRRTDYTKSKPQLDCSGSGNTVTDEEEEEEQAEVIDFQDESALNLESIQQAKSTADSRKSKAVTMQAIMYTLVFFATYFCWMLDQIFWATITEHQHNVVLVFAFVLVLPLQGFLNCLVFIRQRDMQTWEGKLFRSIVCCSWCCCCIEERSAGTRQNGASQNHHQGNSNHLKQEPRMNESSVKTIDEELTDLSLEAEGSMHVIDLN